ncbi:DHH family phosphoesterase [Methanolobus halotolerans]|uniref:Phosphoesterase n=1 Tax=Methanolobus halotolerans TaxID=2052935 RepID=A0A4E0PTA1_9EURY|nr:DHH family phosphoesterase [Methanolobus halotolerans]TGC07397.1 phosphoesterase [Methanolobus halotolerans]
MSEKCNECDGKGYNVVGSSKCPECKGAGKSKSVDLMKLSQKDVDSFLKNGSNCDRCGGTGEVETRDICIECSGKGAFYKCKICGNAIADLYNGEEVCAGCSKKQVVYKLDDSCDINEVEIGKYYHAVVRNLADFGVFVDLNSNLRGLIHSSNIKEELKVGEPVIVGVKEIRPKGKLDLLPVKIKEYQTVELEKGLPVKLATEVSKLVGMNVKLEGEVIQVKQTAGPTIFTIADETGQVSAAAFESAGERAYPHISSDMIVSATGEITARGDSVQLEIKSLKKLSGPKESEILKRIEAALDRRAEPHDIEFMVDSEVLEKLRPAMMKVAKEIRKAVIKSTPILLRHHADADGMTAALAIEKAILPLIREVNGQDGEYYFYKRAPSKAPFYEMTDVVRDITFAVEDVARHGQKMPLVVSVDNGSTLEDVPAMKQARVYGINMIVVDHHHPDKEVDDYLIAHVNPAHVGGDFGMTAGMLCTEVARMLNPDVEAQIKHLPAVAAVGDRSEAEEAKAYISMVSDAYSLQDLKDMALALDFEAYWLKFNNGKGILDDILNFGDTKVHKNLVKLLCEQANEMISEQIDVCMAHVKTQTLPNGALLNVLDVENYAHKFTFPPPGKTSGEVHDRLCKKFEGKPVITLGFGPDFAVIRSKGVRMNIPQMVRELHEEVKGGGVNGGGHLVVGSIKFVEGMRTEVLSKLAEKVGSVEVD